MALAGCEEYGRRRRRVPSQEHDWQAEAVIHGRQESARLLEKTRTARSSVTMTEVRPQVPLLPGTASKVRLLGPDDCRHSRCTGRVKVAVQRPTERYYR